jgi:hypothetical protein
MVSKNEVWRARLRPMICLTRARQGRPKKERSAARGFLFCGSTVDWRRRDRDLALKTCAPGMFAEKGFKI